MDSIHRHTAPIPPSSLTFRMTLGVIIALTANPRHIQEIENLIINSRVHPSSAQNSLWWYMGTKGMCVEPDPLLVYIELTLYMHSQPL